MTPARQKLLSLAASDKHGRLIGGDPRTREALISAGYFEIYGYNFGPLFRITDSGRTAISATRTVK